MTATIDSHAPPHNLKNLTELTTSHHPKPRDMHEMTSKSDEARLWDKHVIIEGDDEESIGISIRDMNLTANTHSELNEDNRKLEEEVLPLTCATIIKDCEDYLESSEKEKSGS